MLLRILANIFGKIVEIRNRRFESGRAFEVQCNVPVISIGNIITGGSSKTPFVSLLTELLIENKIKPAIVSRGYKKQKKGMVIVRNNDKVTSTVEEAGDEMLMLAEYLPVPIVADESKSQAALYAEKAFNIDCILIDDGFQHRRLYRDLDIVLINEETLMKPMLLPAGRFRELPSSLNRADVICFIDIPSNKILNDFLSMINLKENVIICRAETKIGKPYKILGGQVNEMEIENLKMGTSAVAAIANPQRFEKSLTCSGYKLEKTFWFRDHYYFKENDILRLIKALKYLKQNNILITEKDAVKIKKWQRLFNENVIQCWFVPLKIEFTEGKEIFEKKLLNLFINQLTR